MNIKTLAWILLIFRLLSMGFIVLVLRRQMRLFKLYIQPQLRTFRKVLFLLALIVFIGNLIPIVVDLLTVFSKIHRVVSRTNMAGVVYALSNDLVSLSSSVFIWYMYRVAAKTLLIVENRHNDSYDKV